MFSGLMKTYWLLSSAVTAFCVFLGVFTGLFIFNLHDNLTDS